MNPGFTVLFCPFPNPLSHAYVYGEVPPLAVALKLNVDPTQPDLSAPASTVGPFVLLMVVLAVAVHPLLSVTVTL